MSGRLIHNLTLRPAWMNVVMLFCFYMAFIYVPWDIFVKPVSEDQEVWFGVLFYGWLAKAGGVLHWIIYGAFAYGIWNMKSWLRKPIVLYLWQVSFSMIFWTWGAGASMNWSGFAVGFSFLYLSYLFYKYERYSPS